MGRRHFLLLFLMCCSSAIFSHSYLLAQTPVPLPTAESPVPRASGVATPSSSTTTPPSSTLQASTPQTLAGSNIKLGIGDLIDVSVFGVPDLTTRARISESGDIYLPLIDYVHVADLTTDEAQDLIQKRLGDGGYVRNPHVSIFVDESASQAINVLGEVNRPGPLPAIGDRHLLDVISATGGLTDRAGRLVTIQHRDGQKIEVQLSASLAEDPKNNVEILPGDTVIVSRAGIIYVVGDVGHPSGFAIEDNSLSVLKALALAGGGTRTSALKNSRILRQTPSGVTEIPINLKRVLYAKAPDVPLVKGDVLFVPGSAAKEAVYRTADAAMTLSTALAVVAVH
jgi:polysaccharide biosynthesis/export protein